MTLTDRPPRAPLVLCLCVAAVFVAGCDGGTEVVEPVPTLVGSESATRVAEEAAAATATALAAPSATAEPTELPVPTVLPDDVSAPEVIVRPGGVGESLSEEELAAVVAEVSEVHTRFMTELYAFDERTGQRGPSLELIDELTTGDHRDRVLGFAAERQTAGDIWISRGYASSIVDLEFGVDMQAVVIGDCSFDTTAQVSAIDEEAEPLTQQSAQIRATRLDLVDGEWKVSRFVAGGNEPCDQ